MPDIEDRGIPSEPVPEFRRRRRKHRRKPIFLRYWWVAPLAVLLFFIPSLWRWAQRPHFRPGTPTGYISSRAQLEEEFLQYTGQPLLTGEAGQHFQQANELTAAGSYANAAIELETVSRLAAVPLVFNNLGVLYANSNDGEHAVRAFRDALARDHQYAPALTNIKSLNLGIAADPGSKELEPNNSAREANVVWLNRPIEGTIGSGSKDFDYFWFTTPRPPRDRVAVQVFSKSSTLTPQLSIADSTGKAVMGVRQASAAGGTVRFDLAPAPNASYYLQVTGAGGNSGDYTLSVDSLHAFDVYEPNDSVLNPTPIRLDEQVSANIMDATDTDYFSFSSSKDGSVTVEVDNGQPDMVLGLTVLTPDRRTSGFAPDAQPGASIRHTVPVQANQTYYLQVWSKSETSGPYSLIVKAALSASDSDQPSDEAAPPVKPKRKRRH